MKKIIACEPGNYASKLAIKKGNGIETESILNVISMGKKRRSFGSNLKEPINLLDVTITSPADGVSGRWFVGGLAEKEGLHKITPTRTDEKSDNPMTIIMMLTTLAFHLREEKTVSIELGTTLPTEEYFTDGCEDKLKNKLIGEHTVKFHDPVFKGAEVKLCISNVEVLPEGTAGLIALSFDWNGEFVAEQLANITLLVIDIGKIDMNFAVLDEGAFLGKALKSFKGGTIDVVREVKSYLYDEYKYEVDVHKLDYLIRKRQPILIGSDETVNVEELAERYSEVNMRALANQIEEELRDKSIKLQDVNAIKLIGGGSFFYHKGIMNKFKGVRVEVPEDGRLKNIEGVLKYMYQNRSEAAATSEEDLYKHKE